MPKRVGTIGSPKIPPDNRRLCFSFRLVRKDNRKFDHSTCTDAFFRALFETIQRYSTFTLDQFKEYDHQEHRRQIIFEDTTEPKGFPIDPAAGEIWTDEPWQFAISRDRRAPQSQWRVHGFIAERVFYVVWLDPDHKLSKTADPLKPKKKK